MADVITVPTIRAWATSYEAVYQYPYKAAPPTDAPPAQFDGNTTNDAYSVGDVISISNWEITEDLLSTFKDILNLPYPYPLMDEKLQPLRKWHNNCQQCPFRHETCLTGRLQSTVFEDLSRVLKYISSVVAAERSKGKELFPNSRYTPLLTECGSCAKNYDSFLPDRCSYPACLDVARDRPPVTGCPGEIKPSYKFRGHWAPKDQLYPGDHDLKPILEYRKVLAQLKFYIRYMGQYNEDEDGAYTEPDISLTGKAGRYGYVITDEEVVLVSCEPHQVARGLRSTPGFPLRPSAAVRPIFSDSEDNERHNQEAAYDAESDTDHSNADYPSSDDGQDQYDNSSSGSSSGSDDSYGPPFMGELGGNAKFFRQPQDSQAVKSGMLALILIHLLAANDASLY